MNYKSHRHTVKHSFLLVLLTSCALTSVVAKSTLLYINRLDVWHWTIFLWMPSLCYTDFCLVCLAYFAIRQQHKIPLGRMLACVGWILGSTWFLLNCCNILFISILGEGIEWRVVFNAPMTRDNLSMASAHFLKFVMTLLWAPLLSASLFAILHQGRFSKPFCMTSLMTRKIGICTV